MQALQAIGQSLLAAAGMAWQVLWSLVLGFLISGMIQTYVSRAKMSEALGRAGLKEIAMATGFGAASSSCSYAAIAAAKSMFKRGAHFIPAPTRHFVQTVTTFSLNYTAVLNIVTLVAIGVLIFLNVRYPMQMLMDHSMHDHHPMAEMGGDEDGMPRTAHEGRTMG